MSYELEYEPGGPRSINLTPVADWLGLGAFVRGNNPELDAYVDGVADKLTDRVRYQLAVSESCSDDMAEELRGHIRGLVDDFTHPRDITDTPREEDFMAVLEFLYKAGGNDIPVLTALVRDYRRDARWMLAQPDIQEATTATVWPEDVPTDPSLNRRAFWHLYGIVVATLQRMPRQRGLSS